MLRRFPHLICLVCLVTLSLTASLVACAPSDTADTDADAAPATDPVLVADAQAFLDEYTARFLDLYYTLNQAEWASNTKIVEGDDTNAERTEAANKAYAEFTGGAEVIEKARTLLESKDQLEDVQVRQLESILYRAANNPQTVPDLVEQRIAAETKQNEKLFGFDFQVGGKSVSTNDIDDILTSSTDLDERLGAWQASKEVGTTLKDGLANLVELRNGTVQALGYDNYFDYQVSEYGMTSAEMLELNQRLVKELWPLYRQLHTWARYELAADYGAEVPDLLPAHWLPNRWGQDWVSMVTVEGMDMNAKLGEHDAEWIVKEGEAFYVSLGFPELPQVFWDKSSLYPLPEGTDYKKNNHASAWHLDLQNDVRSLMSVQPNESWWTTTHHELGHIYYYIAYTNPEVPPLLREGANRAFHEGIGSLLGMVSMQKPFLVAKGLVDENAETDEIQQLLKEAVDSVVFIPWSAGVMTHFERDLYTGLTQDEYNQRWWQYKEAFQGIVPPSDRGEEYCDAASKTHINNDAAQYYDYALSYIILHQMHRHIADNILGEDPRATNYWGRTDVGEFLNGILEVGGTRDWRELMKEELGEEISAQAMLAYFEPLQVWLEEQNEGREHALPETPSI